MTWNTEFSPFKIDTEYTVWGVKLHYTCKGAKWTLSIYSNDAHTVCLTDMYVEPRYRRKGYGNCILRNVEEETIRNGAFCICVICNKTSWMHDWFERNKFKDRCDDEQNNNLVWMHKYLPIKL